MSVSNHLYENSAFSECSSTLRSSKVQPMKRDSRSVIAFSILITACLILSISALVIALLPGNGNEDATTAATLTLQKSKTEENAKHLELTILRFESANEALEAALNQTQKRLKGLENLESANTELGSALNQTQEKLKMLEDFTALRFQEVNRIVNSTKKGKFQCFNLKTQ